MTRPAVACVLAAGALVAIAAGCGAEEEAPAAVGWQGRPVVIRPPELPQDRIVTGRLVLTAGDGVDLRADDVRVVDGQGRALPSVARYVQGFSHTLYSPRRAPADRGALEQRRLGEVATLRRGAPVPLTVSWRRPAGRGRPVRAVLGDGLAVELP